MFYTKVYNAGFTSIFLTEKQAKKQFSTLVYGKLKQTFNDGLEKTILYLHRIVTADNMNPVFPLGVQNEDVLSRIHTS